MATLKAIIRKDQPDAKGLCRIIILYRNGNEPAIKHSIGEKVLPKQFDSDKEKVIKHEGAKKINHKIEQQRQLLNNIVFDIQRNGDIPSTSLVKSFITSYEEKIKSKQLIGFQSKANTKKGRKWIDSHKDYGWIQKDLTPSQAWEQLMFLKKNVVSKETLGIYRTTLEHLKIYCINHRRKLDWDLFDTDFYTYWNNYFIEECENRYGDFGLANNTIGKYFKTLKTFLYWAEDKEYHNNNKFKKYKVIQETIDIHPLSEAHLAKVIWFCDNDKNELILRKVASLFVFLATTGLRYSDGQNLKWSDIFYTGEGDIDQQIIRLTSQKTNQKLMIPLSSYSITELVRNAIDFEKGKLLISEILKPNKGIFDLGDTRKYFDNKDDLNKSLMPQITSSQFNKQIKEVGKRCGFNEPITVVYKSGAKIFTKRFKRWEKLSSHDCRRTFITLSLSKGMRPETVMSFTGHKSYKTMLRYNKLTDKIKIDEFHDIWGKSKKIYDDFWGNIEVTSLVEKKHKEDKTSK